MAAAQTGVGLTLAPHGASGALKITHMDPDGPAAKGGLVQVGDVLYDVDDTSIVGLHGAQVRTLIVGPPGSPVTLGLRRNNGKLFYVRIQRAAPKPGAAAPPQRPAPAAAPPNNRSPPIQQQQQQQRSPQQPPRPAYPQRQPYNGGADDGQVVGIGVGLALDSNGNLCISSLLPGSPAKRSGLLEEGDVLRYIDGKDVRGLVPEDVRPLILGKAGTFVTLSVQRGNTQIVARMARAKPSTDTAPPRAGSSSGAKADTNTYSAAYAQVTADRRSVERPAALNRDNLNNSVPKESTTPTARDSDRYAPAPQRAPSQQNAPVLTGDKGESDQELCGIGIVLAQNMLGELVVLSMNEGGPAARSNLIKRNDVLYTIDQHDVYKQTIEQVRPLILGLPGSTVVLGFQRQGMRNNRPVNVRLRRGTVKHDLKNIPNPSPRPSPSVTPGGGATPKQSPHHTPTSTRPSSPRLGAQQRREGQDVPGMRRPAREPENEENKYGPDGPVCGLGVVLVPAENALCVASITEGGPAARSGRVLRGDLVETINGVSVKNMSINDVRPLILGRAGTSVTLGLRRESEDSVVYVRVMREPVRLGEVLVPGMRNVPEDSVPPPAPHPQMQHNNYQQPPPPPQQQQQQPPPQPQYERPVERVPAPEPIRDVLPTEMQTIQNANQNNPRVQAAQRAQQQQRQQQQQQQQGATGTRMCGVGVVLVQVSGGAVCVKSVNKGGSAYKSGQIVRGDVLYAIDNTKVLGWDVERVKPLILGLEGTPITMTFQRVGNLVHGKRGFDVTMNRSVIEDGNQQMPVRRPYERAALG